MKADGYQQYRNGSKGDVNRTSFPLIPVQAVTSRDSLPSNLESRLQEAWLQTQVAKFSDPRIKSKFFGDVDSTNSRSNGGYNQRFSSSLGKRDRSPDASSRRVSLNTSLERLWTDTHSKSSTTLPLSPFANSDSASSNQDVESSLDGGAVNRQEAWKLLDNQSSMQNDFMGEDFFKGLDGLHDAFDEMEDLLSAGGFEIPDQNFSWEETLKQNGQLGDAGSQFDLIDELLRNNDDSSMPSFPENNTQNNSDLSPSNPNSDRPQDQVSLEMLHAKGALEKIHKECARRSSLHNGRPNSSPGSTTNKGGDDNCPQGKAVKTLISVAQAVVEGDMEKVHKLLTELNSMASTYGDVSQRISAYFLEGLIARMAKSSFESNSPVLESALRLTQESKIDEWEADVAKCNEMSEEEREKSFVDPHEASPCRHLLESFQVLVNSSPYLTFGQVAANSAILETFSGHNYVHIVDFGIGQGLHWHALIQALAARPNGPPHVRLTGIEPPKFVDNCQFPPSFCPIKASYHLSNVADQWGVPFEIDVIHCKLEDINVEMLKLREGETLAVNCTLRLHQLICEAEYPEKDIFSQVFQTIKSMNPAVCTIVEQSSDFNTPFFLTRFYEALYYYFNVFESLDSAMPRASKERQVYEQYVLGRSIVNIVAGRGKERSERQEQEYQWKRKLLSNGFVPKEISGGMIATVKALLQTYGGGYSVKAGNGNLTLYWGDKPLLIMSTWK